MLACLDCNHICFKILDYDEDDVSSDVLPPRAEIKEDEELQRMLEPYILNPDFSPLMREDLTGLPPAYIMTVEFDVLRDEGIAYGKRLQVSFLWCFVYNANFLDARSAYHNAPFQEWIPCLPKFSSWNRRSVQRSEGYDWMDQIYCKLNFLLIYMLYTLYCFIILYLWFYILF